MTLNDRGRAGRHGKCLLVVIGDERDDAAPVYRVSGYRIWCGGCLLGYSIWGEL